MFLVLSFEILLINKEHVDSFGLLYMMLTLFINNCIDEPFVNHTIDMLKRSALHAFLEIFNVIANLRHLVLLSICDVKHLSLFYSFLLDCLNHLNRFKADVICRLYSVEPHFMVFNQNFGVNAIDFKFLCL